MTLLVPSRRSFVAGALSLLAAPAIVQASSLMPVRAIDPLFLPRSNSLLTIEMITREAVQLFQNSNAFLQSLDRQYDDQFARDGAKIGTVLRIRLPNDYTHLANKTSWIDTPPLPEIPVVAAIPLAAAAVLVKNPEVSRRGMFSFLREEK